jgi:hypothetical protein
MLASDACRAIRNALTAPWLSAFSKAGQAIAVQFSRDQPEAIATWDGVLTSLLANPVTLRDVTIWCLFFAALEGAAQFQLDDCPSPSEEGHLSGLLLGALKARCECWRRTAASPLARSKSSLSLQRIDLSILGGEQATGGDFGLILDFDDERIQPAKALGRRIVPLIFQAKRYVRPCAPSRSRTWRTPAFRAGVRRRRLSVGREEVFGAVLMVPCPARSCSRHFRAPHPGMLREYMAVAAAIHSVLSIELQPLGRFGISCSARQLPTSARSTQWP